MRHIIERSSSKFQSRHAHNSCTVWTCMPASPPSGFIRLGLELPSSICFTRRRFFSNHGWGSFTPLLRCRSLCRSEPCSPLQCATSPLLRVSAYFFDRRLYRWSSIRLTPAILIRNLACLMFTNESSSRTSCCQSLPSTPDYPPAPLSPAWFKISPLVSSLIPKIFYSILPISCYRPTDEMSELIIRRMQGWT